MKSFPEMMMAAQASTVAGTLIQQRPDGPIASQTSAAAPAINVTNVRGSRPHKGPLTSGA
jgi:hypothetical protein